jgi:glyoxylase-like metal-dependent hydrolase (beta-lactamase superfamily II)
MNKPATTQQIAPGIYRFNDTCNVYVIADPAGSLAIDFGSGAWLAHWTQLGFPPVTRVLLTHHHADQCAGLTTRESWPFQVYAPRGEDAFFTAQGVQAFKNRGKMAGNPASYSVIDRPMPPGLVQCVLDGFTDHPWLGGELAGGARRIRIIHTPGHGPHALSYLIDDPTTLKQILFCGDACHASATIHEPYHLEWDHWTGSGALAAWEGLIRLGGLKVDILCPSHGPIINKAPGKLIQRLKEKVLRFYLAKGQIAQGESDGYITLNQSDQMPDGLGRWLHRFGVNGWLLTDPDHKQAVVFDPMAGDEESLKQALARAGNPGVDAVTATHYHFDHCDGLHMVREKFNARIVLHPQVAQVLAHPDAYDMPWRLPAPITPDQLTPAEGEVTLGNRSFRVGAFLGQTRYHAGYMTMVGGWRLFFGGDNFFPTSRWNGTGGFCAYNHTRPKLFGDSAKKMLTWSPDVLANGHDTCFRFRSSRAKKIIKWSARAEKALRDLCPSGNIEKGYNVF